MANLSFDIVTSKDFYDKLVEDYNDYKISPTSSRLAVNCAMTSWHLGEWLYEEFKPILQDTYSDKKAYLTYLETTACLSLETMHRITNGSKHCLRAGATHKVQGTEKHIGAFSSEFSREFDQTALIVSMDDGSAIWFEDEIDAVMAFWQAYIPSTFGLTL